MPLIISVISGKTISDKLYNAVAIALAYIYRIEQGQTAEEPDITIPDELTFDVYYIVVYIA